MSLLSKIFGRKPLPVIAPPIDAAALRAGLDDEIEKRRNKLIAEGKYLTRPDPLFKPQRAAVVNPHVPSDAELPVNVTRLRGAKAP